MNDNIFRKQSLDRISSPEQLTDYIKVSNPSVWVILSAVTLLLISALIWSVFGKLPETLKVNVKFKDGVGTCYVGSESFSKLKVGMKAETGEASGTVTGVSVTPVSASELSQNLKDDYTVSKLLAGNWNYPVTVNVSGLPDGIYEMVITVDSVKPISFIWN